MLAIRSQNWRRGERINPSGRFIQNQQVPGMRSRRSTGPGFPLHPPAESGPAGGHRRPRSRLRLSASSAALRPLRAQGPNRPRKKIDVLVDRERGRRFPSALWACRRDCAGIPGYGRGCHCRRRGPRTSALAHPAGSATSANSWISPLHPGLPGRLYVQRGHTSRLISRPGRRLREDASAPVVVELDRTAWLNPAPSAANRARPFGLLGRAHGRP